MALPPSRARRAPRFALSVGLAFLLVSGCGPKSSTAPVDDTPDPPLIVLSTTAVAFTATAGGANPAPQGVNLSNGAAGSLSQLTTSITYGAGQTPGWLVAALGGTVAPTTLSLTATMGSLATGSYTATVSVIAAGASNTPQSVSVTLTVTAPPSTIVLGTQQISFNAQLDGASPAAQTVSITNGAQGTLSGLTAAVQYAAGQPGGWLATSLSATTAPSTLTLTPTTSGLAAGTYSADVGVASSSASNSPQVVSVTVTVAENTPLIELNSSSVNVSVVYQSTDSIIRTVDVSNGGGGTLGGLSVAVAFGQPDQPTWLTAKLDKTTAPATLTLTVAALASFGDGAPLPGTYTATVLLVSSEAANSPQTIEVTLTVTAPQPQIELYADWAELLPLTLNFAATTPGANPAVDTVYITDRYEGLAGGTPLTGLTFSIAYPFGTPGWLTVFQDSTTAPAKLAVSPTTGSLAPGVYYASVEVASPVAENSPQTFWVSFTVEAAPAPTVVSSDPQPDEVSVGVERVLHVTFSADMDPTTVNASTFTVTGQVGAPPIAGPLPPPGLVGGTVTYDAATRVAAFTPNAPDYLIEFASVYEVRITTGARDANGVAVAEDIVFSFTTVEFDSAYGYRMWNYQDGPNWILGTANVAPFGGGMLETQPSQPHLDNSVWYFTARGGAYQMHTLQFGNAKALTVDTASPTSDRGCWMRDTEGNYAGSPGPEVWGQLWVFEPHGNQKYSIRTVLNGTEWSLGALSHSDSGMFPTDASMASQSWTLARHARRF